jgi:allantoinase
MTASSPSRFAIRSTNVVTPGKIQALTLLIDHGKIHSLLPHNAPLNCPVTDVGSQAILPGVVDTHVHINDPDAPPRIAWEGFASATKAAAAGGITTLIDMPLNCTPVTTTLPALHAKRAAFERMGRGHVDVGFHAGLIHGNAGEIESLLNAGVVGVKAFLVHSGIDDFPAAKEADLRAVMPLLAQRRVPLLAHAEMDDIAAGSPPNDNVRSYARYLASRPAHWETAAIDLLIRLAEEYRCPTHIVHLATEEALPLLRAARARGVPITVETCPHYLHFTAEDIPEGATHYKCAPPIREQKTREALWTALRLGDIDMIASDHSPCPPALKRMESGDFSTAWGGISALQLMLPVIHNDAAPRGASLLQLAHWLSEFPAKLVGLHNKGTIAAGKDADLVVFDPTARFTVDAAALHHRYKITPYDGETLQGIVRQTYLRGTLIYDDGRFPAAHHGQLLTHERTGHVRH